MQLEIDLLAAEIDKAAIDRIIHARDKRRLIRTQEKRQRGDFPRLCHSSNRLRLGQFLEHLRLAPGISLANIVIDKRSVDPGRRDAIAADLSAQIISDD